MEQFNRAKETLSKMGKKEKEIFEAETRGLFAASHEGMNRYERRKAAKLERKKHKALTEE